ncbi:MAG: DUF58 domain-containing protein [Chloroflexota bacterium]
MFTQLWVVAIAVLAIVGLILHATALFFLALAVGAIALCARIWERYCLVGVEYRRTLTSDRVFFGDSIDLDVEIINRKALPLAWLEVEDELPRRLPPRHGRVRPSFKADRSWLVNVVALRPFERVRRHFTIPCLERGEHTVGPVLVRSGDLFGFFRRQEERRQSERFLVYPKVLPVARLGLPPRQPLGDVRRPSWIFEDPAWVAGVREYTSRDGMRKVHWRASARSQRLQVKVYDATTDHQIALFVNLHTAGPSWWWMAFDEVAIEMIAVTAASLARWACQERLPVGLYVNGHPRDQQSPISLPPTGDPAQYPRILEALARMQPFAKVPIEQFMAEQTTRLPFGSTVVVITARLTDTLLEAGRQSRRRGHSPVMVVVGERPGLTEADGVAIRFVPGAEIWRDLTALTGDAGP